jgi:hypothetical protein
MNAVALGDALATFGKFFRVVFYIGAEAKRPDSGY